MDIKRKTFRIDGRLAETWEDWCQQEFGMFEERVAEVLLCYALSLDLQSFAPLYQALKEWKSERDTKPHGGKRAR